MSNQKNPGFHLKSWHITSLFIVISMLTMLFTGCQPRTKLSFQAEYKLFKKHHRMSHHLRIAVDGPKFAFESLDKGGKTIRQGVYDGEKMLYVWSKEYATRYSLAETSSGLMRLKLWLPNSSLPLSPAEGSKDMKMLDHPVEHRKGKFAEWVTAEEWIEPSQNIVLRSVYHSESDRTTAEKPNGEILCTKLELTSPSQERFLVPDEIKRKSFPRDFDTNSAYKLPGF